MRWLTVRHTPQGPWSGPHAASPILLKLWLWLQKFIRSLLSTMTTWLLLFQRTSFLCNLNALYHIFLVSACCLTSRPPSDSNWHSLNGQTSWFYPCDVECVGGNWLFAFSSSLSYIGSCYRSINDGRCYFWRTEPFFLLLVGCDSLQRIVARNERVYSKHTVASNLLWSNAILTISEYINDECISKSLISYIEGNKIL